MSFVEEEEEPLDLDSPDLTEMEEEEEEEEGEYMIGGGSDEMDMLLEGVEDDQMDDSGDMYINTVIDSSKNVKPPRKGLFQKLGAWNRNRKERRESRRQNRKMETLLFMEPLDDTIMGVNTSTDAIMDAMAMEQGGEATGTKIGGLNLVAAVESLTGGPFMATAQIPLAFVVALLLIRAVWYYREYTSKIRQQKNGGAEEQNGYHNGTSSKGTMKGTKGHYGSNGATTVMAASVSSSSSTDAPKISNFYEEKLKATLEKEAYSKQALAEENKSLQQALDTHKSTVDKFNSELQARNERLSVFEQEQDTVRRELSAQIEVLKSELQERQKQEQGNLKSKETLCNDLISKIKALNQDLENHEKLWQGVAQKAQQKEDESAKKVENLQKALREEEQQRVAALAAKEEATAELNAQVQVLQQRQAAMAAKTELLDQRMGSKMFPTAEAKLQETLEEEKKHAAALTNKLQVFSAELQSREARVSTLDAKMNEVERLSTSELRQLQRELQDQVAQREKLQQAAVEMTRLLQEKRDQCVRLQTQWESSKAELKALEERVTALTADVAKRETNAAARIAAFEKQLQEERDELDNCKRSTEETNGDLVKKQEEFVQLTTRMDLFLKELQFRDDQVASLEQKLDAKEELTTSEIKSLREKLAVQSERRDTWNKSTEDLQQLLKDKKAQVVGLTTRADLFERELQNRQDCVAALLARIEEREESEALKMEPYRKQLRLLQDERDAWRQKTEEIGDQLEQKMGQTQGLTTRLMLFKAELVKKDERLTALKSTYQDKKEAIFQAISPLREQLEKQREQRDFWTAKTDDIDRVLKEKRAQCVGLSTRVHLFTKELETKEQVAAMLEKKTADKQEAGDAVIGPLRKRLEEQTHGRDQWKESTDKVKQLLSDKRQESAGLTMELKGLVSDLQSYQKRRAALEKQLKEQRSLLKGRKEALQEKLQACEEYRDEWKVKTAEVGQQLTLVEQSIVGLKTREMLFMKELQYRRDTFADLEEKFRVMEENGAAKMTRLQETLAAEKAEDEIGVEATLRLNQELKTIKRECIGLTTRSKLFREELEKRKLRVTENEAKIGEVEEAAAYTLGRLQTALSEMENDRNDWREKAAKIDALVVKNEAESLGLSTRLDLFMSEVMGHEETVKNLEAKFRNQRNAYTKASITNEYEAAKARRDQWTEKAIDIERSLNQRRSEIAGLKTRQNLFHVEVKRREGQVSALKAKIAEKKKHFAAKIDPLKGAHEQLLQQRDEWASKADGIDKVLADKQELCLPISGKLEEVIDQLTQRKKRIRNLEAELRDEESFTADEVASLKRKLGEQRNDLHQWEERTKEVQALLRGKYDSIPGLNTRIKTFEYELNNREAAVKSVESKIAENARLIAEEISSISSQIEAEHRNRDVIIETTMAKNQELKRMEDTCVAMTVRRKLFEDEMRSRNEQVAALQTKLQDKEDNHSHIMKAMKAELSLKVSDRDKWGESTRSIDRLWKETERECVGLSTRLQLFLVEKQKYEEQVDHLEGKLNREESTCVNEIAPIHFKLKKEQEDRDSWDKKTVELDNLLNATKREVVGLKTRSKLFKKELNQKEQRVAKLTAKVEEDDDEFAQRMEPLRREYKTQDEGCDAWEKTTLEVKSKLVQTQSECASIPTRLDLFRREQKKRDDAVEELESCIFNKEDLVAVQLGFLLNELQLQQKQRGKWKKVTLEMHRVLKETKEQVDDLTDKLEASRADLKMREEKVASLETALRDGKDMAAQQLNTLKNEVRRQKEMRDNLRLSTAEVGRRLEAAKEQCNDVSERLLSSGAQVQECTTAIENLEARVVEKKAQDSSQIESIKAQLKIHLEQRTEWRENTNQMKQRLKEKQYLCAGLQSKIALLKKLQQGDAGSSVPESRSTASSKVAPNGISAHVDWINDMSNGLAKKSDGEEKLRDKMNALENELRSQQDEEKKMSDSTQQLEQDLGAKEAQCEALTGQLAAVQAQSGGIDVDAMLKEKEQHQSSLNSKLASLTGELLNL